MGNSKGMFSKRVFAIDEFAWWNLPSLKVSRRLLSAALAVGSRLPGGCFRGRGHACKLSTAATHRRRPLQNQRASQTLARAVEAVRDRMRGMERRLPRGTAVALPYLEGSSGKSSPTTRKYVVRWHWPLHTASTWRADRSWRTDQRFLALPIEYYDHFAPRDGELEVKQLLLLMALFCNATLSDQLSWMFDVFDTDGDGSMNEVRTTHVEVRSWLAC